ncbi:hypothetical protein DPMN_133436 [Dreissena polymorpha]|uniref:SAP domain-containing protein n=1 Tax=Dreissena polymorpha TaxID=45954 RepID=A0A9D4FWZ9_DREPO|nr:hypothetical protein DPMN_133436 [Dreissena polymorpha]
MKASDNTVKDFDVNKANCAELRQYFRQHGLLVSGSKKEVIERANGSVEIGKQPLKVLRLQDENFATERARNRLLTPLGYKLPEVKSIASGWSSDVNLIPYFSDIDLYNYLVLNNQRTFDDKPIGAKRQLKAKVFFSDGHVHSVIFHEINIAMSKHVLYLPFPHRRRTK